MYCMLMTRDVSFHLKISFLLWPVITFSICHSLVPILFSLYVSGVDQSSFDRLHVTLNYNLKDILSIISNFPFPTQHYLRFILSNLKFKIVAMISFDKEENKSVVKSLYDCFFFLLFFYRYMWLIFLSFSYRDFLTLCSSITLTEVTSILTIFFHSFNNIHTKFLCKSCCL